MGNMPVAVFGYLMAFLVVRSHSVSTNYAGYPPNYSASQPRLLPYDVKENTSETPIFTETSQPQAIETVLDKSNDVIRVQPIQEVQMASPNGQGSLSTSTVEEMSNEVQDNEEKEGSGSNLDEDLDTEATFIIGAPHYRPYSHYPINYFPSYWYRPRYHHHHHRPRPVPYIRTYHRGKGGWGK